MGIREDNHPLLIDTYCAAAARLSTVHEARMGAAYGHPMLPLSFKELRTLGVVYFSAVPTIENRLLTMLTEVVSKLRIE
jgi:hypothetical protein